MYLAESRHVAFGKPGAVLEGVAEADETASIAHIALRHALAQRHPFLLTLRKLLELRGLRSKGSHGDAKGALRSCSAIILVCLRDAANSWRAGSIIDGANNWGSELRVIPPASLSLLVPLAFAS